MSSNSDYDRIAARLRGTASPAELAALERELASDADLARRARDLDQAWSLTEGFEPPRPSSTTFEDLLELRRRAHRRLVVRRAAAALLIFAPITWAVCALTHTPDDSAPSESIVRPADRIELEHVPLDAPALDVDDELGERELALLTDFVPTRDETVQFLTSLEDARVVAAATGRPMFVFGYVQGCPWCIELRGKTFAEPNMRELITHAVPVAIDLLAAEQSVSAPLFERGYPALELQDSHGAVLEVLSGPPGTVDLAVGLERALKREAHSTPALTWAAMNDLARKLVKSSSDERQGRYSNAWIGYTEVARLARTECITRCAEAGRSRIASVARAALLDARERWQHDAAGSERALSTAIESLSGTPFAADLRGVLTFVSERRAFPKLVARGG